MKLLLLALALAAAAPAKEKEFSVYPALDKDARLRAVISADYPNEKLGKVLARLHQQLGVNLAAEGDLIDSRVSLLLKGRQGRAVLTDVGVLLQGYWVKRGPDDYLLVRTEHDARLVLNANGARIYDCARQLVGSLRPPQWAALYRNGRLEVSELSAPQRRLFQMALFQRYFSAPEEYHEDVLVGNRGGVIYAAPGPGERPENRGAIGLWAPTAAGVDGAFGLMPLP
jgi:hypothetical protein